MPFLPSLNRDCQDTLEEIPVTSTPIFEGHLSVRNEKKQWQWRLFRFDGSCFTCLSTRKIKLPPHTTLDDQVQLSYSSPLLATPKDINKRLYGNKAELKYYQLPEWTIDVVNISSISVLKRINKRTPSKCFSLRTFDQHCIILKAQKQKDLERWLFVLTKMWKFTQAVKNQVQQQVEDNIPLVHSIIIPQPYRPSLSEEKIRVIEEWRKSLAELMANDPNIKLSTPPPIEPIPDDDAMSVFTDMTSVSHRLPNTKVKRRTTKRSSPIRRHKSNSIAPQQQQSTQPVDTRPTLKKRRSDDVRNWMNNKPIMNRTASLGSSSKRKPIIQKLATHPGTLLPKGSVSTSPEIIQHMNFFQDVVTVCDDDGCPYEHQQQQMKLRYHTSVKGKKLIQVNQSEQQQEQQQERPQMIHRRASMPLTDQQFIFDQQKMNTMSPLQFLSFHQKEEEEEEEEEEDMSLADLQKSLRQVSLNNHHTRSPSVSSIQDLQRTRYYHTPSIVAPAVPPHQYLAHQPQLYLTDSQQQQNKLNTFDLWERKHASLNYHNNTNNNSYVYR